MTIVTAQVQALWKLAGLKMGVPNFVAIVVEMPATETAYFRQRIAHSRTSGVGHLRRVPRGCHWHTLAMSSRGRGPSTVGSTHLHRCVTIQFVSVVAHRRRSGPNCSTMLGACAWLLSKRPIGLHAPSTMRHAQCLARGRLA